MVDAPSSQVRWPEYHRLINSAYPPIDLFEDIAGPTDWNLLNGAETKTNPRINENVGNLDLIPPERHVGGAGASYVMAPFTHVTPDKHGRFHDGLFGAFYGANTFETALFETVHHSEVFYASTPNEAGWLVNYRELVGSIDANLIDLRGGGFDALLDEAAYTASQNFARDARRDNANGIVYPSVRNPGGECFAAFFPDVMGIPIQGTHLAYHWNGDRIDLVKETDNEQRVFEIIV